jgi:RNA polymerase sigma factor (sigma-70 family)
MIDKENLVRFERLFLPHINAAYNLACWLTRSDSAARDIVKDSCMRALSSSHRWGNPRAWLLTVVRNSSYSWLRESSYSPNLHMDETVEWTEADRRVLLNTESPDVWAARLRDSERMQQVLLDMPPALREVVILKELEGLSYKEIAAITETPVGTVMARLAKARELLKARLLRP